MTVIVAAAIAERDRARPSSPTPASTAVRIGRYSAIVRSSKTSSDSTTGISRLPSQPRSAITFAVMPDEVT